MGFDINIHDQFACESQGAIADRTKENLGSTDKGIVLYRRLLLDAIRKNEAGELVVDTRDASGPPAIDGIGPTAEHRRVLEGIRRNAAQALRLGGMNLPKGMKAVRFSFADQHGVLRGKTLAASAAEAAMERGVTVTSTLLLKDTSHKTVFPAFTPGGGVGMPEMQGAADILMVPDQSTFRVLPWAPDTGWFLCDLQFPDGRPVPFSTRGSLRRAWSGSKAPATSSSPAWKSSSTSSRSRDPRLQPADAGQPGTPPDVELLTTGYQLLTEHKYDQLDRVVELLQKQSRAAASFRCARFEIEFGPSQLEFTLAPQTGIAAADTMILLRSAVKQIARRHGYHATFMCRPKLPNVMSSGWHLHQSLQQERAECFHLRQGGSFRDRQAIPRRPARPRRAARARSPRRRSTATSATAPTRSRPTA